MAFFSAYRGGFACGLAAVSGLGWLAHRRAVCDADFGSKVREFF
jgi:hypothetical protein